MPNRPLPAQLQITEDSSWERLWSGQVAGLLTIARPWSALGVMFLAGYVAHRLWGHAPAAPWAAAGLTLATVGLGVFTWAMSRLVMVGRAHSALTVSGALAWLTVATITGPGEAVTGGILGIVGAAAAMSWNIRHHARHHAQAAGASDPAGRLAGWFKDAAQAAGVPGARMQVNEIGPARAAGKVILPPGEKVAADLTNRARYIEAGMSMPPGALGVTEDPDRADHAQWTLSDPRVLTRPVPWPGPSAPGTSIAHPLDIGMYQDSLPVLYIIVGHHIFEMGASGSGKGMGGAWNLLGEIITRPDACVVGADITKGEQTFGPLRPALHRFETDAKGARSLVDDVTSILKPRTDYLAERGFQKWEQGCGLSYLVAWYEETGRIWDKLGSRGESNLIESALALRSAGGTLVFSIQRNTWDEVPTLIRSQMASMCFGLNDAADCRFGLSEAQQNAGVNPAEWGIRTPGKAVLDAPTIPEDRIAMPFRTYHWGENADLMTAHAAAYPASARPVDPITAQIVGASPAAPAPARPPAALGRPSVVLTGPRPGTRPDAGDQADDDLSDNDDLDPDDDLHDAEDADVCDEYLTTDDPTPELTAGIDDPIEVQDDDEPFDFEHAEPVTPEAAREMFAAQLVAWQAEGRTEFAPRDFPFIGRPGMRRAWVQARLREALDDIDSPVWRDDSDTGGTYRLRETLAPLPS